MRQYSFSLDTFAPRHKWMTANHVLLGFSDGSVVLTKGDITRDRHSKTLTLHEGTCPITGLAFRQASKVTNLFVATLEKVHVSFLHNFRIIFEFKIGRASCWERV